MGKSRRKKRKNIPKRTVRRTNRRKGRTNRRKINSKRRTNKRNTKRVSRINLRGGSPLDTETDKLLSDDSRVVAEKLKKLVEEGEKGEKGKLGNLEDEKQKRRKAEDKLAERKKSAALKKAELSAAKAELQLRLLFANGALSRKELVTKLTHQLAHLRLFLEGTGKSTYYVFEQLNADEDGSITLDEFVKLCAPETPETSQWEESIEVGCEARARQLVELVEEAKSRYISARCQVWDSGGGVRRSEEIPRPETRGSGVLLYNRG